MHQRTRQVALSHKLIYLVVAVVCVMIGIAGLILPIIPGLLFLVAAIFLFGRVSSRFQRWSEKQPAIKRVQLKLSRLETVDFVARVKVVALMSLEMMVDSISKVFLKAKRLGRQFS